MKTKQRAFFMLAPIILGTILSYLCLSWQQSKLTKRDIAFSKNMKRAEIEVDGFFVNGTRFEHLKSIVDGWKKRGSKPIILWIGNSQLNTVNQYSSGQQIALEHLFPQVRKWDMDLITLSPPNGNLQEFYLLLQYMQLYTNIHSVLLSLTFDDMREDGIREDFRDILFIEKIKQTVTTSKILEKYKDYQKGEEDLKALNNTTQKQTENFFNEYLNENWALWEKRPKSRAHIFVSLYFLRNTVFNITPQTKRKVIPSRYKANLQALDALVQNCIKNKINVLSYITPIRNDIEIPYIQAEYSSFKKEIHTFAQKRGIYLQNLENLVPGKYWGQKKSTTALNKQELDFMHFQAAGHILLYKEMKKIIHKEILTK